MKPCWAVVSVRCKPEAAEALHAVLHDFSGRGTVEEPAGEDVVVRAYIDTTGDIGDLFLKISDLVAAVKEQLGGGIVGAPLVQLLADQDWEEAWKRHYRPLRVGKVVICPSWCQPPELGEGDVLIRLDPQIAFGTGTHASTQLSLLALQKTVTPGCAVADVGTGTGILAIAAAKLGAGFVWATDNDETAVAAAQDNVRLNGVHEIVQVHQCDLLGNLDRTVDIVVANISPAAVTKLAPDAAAVLRPGGAYISGGYTRISEADVHAAIEEAGFEISEVLRDQEWRCAIARRR